MEYEIGDDPQGLPEAPGGDRDGGLREDPFLLFRTASARPANRHDDAADEDSPLQQFGEAA